MTDTPLITIVTSSYNAVSTLERCIRSVSEQTFSPVEHIVVDGVSVDGTREVLERYRDRFAWWISEPDEGIYDAWNKAIPHVKGRWVLFLGADDYLHDPEALARIAPHLKTAYPQHPVVYGKLLKVSQDGKHILKEEGKPWDQLRTEFDPPTRKYPPHPSTFHHRSVFNGSESYDRSYRFAADNKLIGSVLKTRDPLFADTVVTCFSMGGATNTPENRLKRWFEKNRMGRELGLDIPIGLKLKSFAGVLFHTALQPFYEDRIQPSGPSQGKNPPGSSVSPGSVRIRHLSILSNGLSGGGAERVLIHLANGFANKGIRTDLLLINDRRDYENLPDPAVNLISLGRGRTLFSLFRLRSVLSHSTPDLLLSGQMHANLLALAVRFAGRFRFPVILTVHSTLKEKRIDPKGIKEWFLLRLSKWFYRYAEALTAVSDAVSKDLLHKMSIPDEKVNVIHNPVVSDEIRRLGDDPPDDPWFHEKTVPVIVSAGRLSPEKDYNTALRAIRRVVDQETPVRYAILGQGKLQQKLEKRVRELGLTGTVRFLGFQKNPYPYIHYADLLLLTSTREGFGNVIVEALMFGTPVVATDSLGGPAEILGQDTFGRLVPAGDSVGIAEAIIQTLQEETDTDKLIRRSRDFTVEAISRQYLDLFEKVMNNREKANIKGGT